MSASSERIFGRKGTNPLKFKPQQDIVPAAPSQRKRQLIAKVKIAQKELRLEDWDYRQILFDETGLTSAGHEDMTEAKLVKVIERFKSRGWQPKLANGQKAAPRPASHPGAGKARAMMISLHHLGVIENASEAALEAFAARQLKCDRLQWAIQSQVFRLIEALKAMAERAGWDQSLAGVKAENGVIVLKRRLVERQLAILIGCSFAHADWDVPRASFALGGPKIDAVILATASQLDAVAQALGRSIWAAKQSGVLK